MGSDLKELSSSLDNTLLQLMDQLEDLQTKRAALNSLIEEGWFSISKARYSMGNKQVSTIQYASEMEPLVLVQTEIRDSGDTEFKTEKAELAVGDENKHYTVDNVGPGEENPACNDGLRRRGPKHQNETKEDVCQHKDTSKEVITANHQDPLKWFGILVPQNLKQAQSAFKQVIDLSAEVASLQSAALATRAKLQKLMKEKQSITLKKTEE